MNKNCVVGYLEWPVVAPMPCVLMKDWVDTRPTDTPLPIPMEFEALPHELQYLSGSDWKAKGWEKSVLIPSGVVLLQQEGATLVPAVGQ